MKMEGLHDRGWLSSASSGWKKHLANVSLESCSGSYFTKLLELLEQALPVWFRCGWHVCSASTGTRAQPRTGTLGRDAVATPSSIPRSR